MQGNSLNIDNINFPYVNEINDHPILQKEIDVDEIFIYLFQ